MTASAVRGRAADDADPIKGSGPNSRRVTALPGCAHAGRRRSQVRRDGPSARVTAGRGKARLEGGGSGVARLPPCPVPARAASMGSFSLAEARAMDDDAPRYLDTRQAAGYPGTGAGTLNRMRVSGEGPRYSKLGRRVVYDLADLDRWVEERKRRFTGESGGEERRRTGGPSRAWMSCCERQ